MMRGSIVVLALVASACARPSDRPRWPAGTLVDLSHDYSDQTVFWPTAESFRLDKVADGFEITASHLNVVAKIPGVDKAKFEEIANRAKAGCPVSKLLKAKITMNAKLEG